MRRFIKENRFLLLAVIYSLLMGILEIAHANQNDTFGIVKLVLTTMIGVLFFAIVCVEIGVLVARYRSNKHQPVNNIKIKYHADIDKIQPIENGDMIDLRAAEDVELKAGEYKLINLGVSMELPHGYMAKIHPRSSTYKNFKIIQGNACGIIDESYCGDSDIWMYPVIALEDTVIHKNDRICQFELVKKGDSVQFIEVQSLDNVSRGGIGSTGRN